MIFFKFLFESISMAFHQLAASKLRSFLSLLGITIGIWSIISVLSAVDSLELNIRKSLDTLGEDVVYLSRFNWGEDPGRNYWKWIRNPNPDFEDYEMIKKRVQSAEIMSYAAEFNAKTVEHQSSNLSNITFSAITYDYLKMYSLNIEEGRYFSQGEYHSGSYIAVIGAEVSKQLFGDTNAIGKEIKMAGRKYSVIGVLERQGNSLLRFVDYDEIILIPLPTAKKFMNVERSRNKWISTKLADGYSMDQLEGEVAAAVRANRRLKPKETNNFFLNKLSILSNVFDQLFGVISVVGWIIGGFAILVGGFGVANIMFVSVKERTNIIGIKKALGAKRYVILLEFLVESIVLCLIGGLMGLSLVYGMIYLVNMADGFRFVMTMQNVIIGAGLSMFIGVLAGILPAFQAANMNPVDAIRA